MLAGSVAGECIVQAVAAVEVLWEGCGGGGGGVGGGGGGGGG